jgi:hypothetical protein
MYGMKKIRIPSKIPSAANSRWNKKFPSLMILLIAGLGSMEARQVKKYQIKSGIVTMEMSMTMGSKRVTAIKVVITFDDYGLKECRDTYSGDKIRDSLISDGENLYLVVHGEQAVYNRGPASQGTEFRFDGERMKSLKEAKKIPNMTIAGKDCEAFELPAQKGVTIMAGWSNICLYMRSSQQSGTVINKAIKLEENAEIPPDKFKVPSGFTLKT